MDRTQTYISDGIPAYHPFLQEMSLYLLHHFAIRNESSPFLNPTQHFLMYHASALNSDSFLSSEKKKGKCLKKTDASLSSTLIHTSLRDRMIKTHRIKDRRLSPVLSVDSLNQFSNEVINDYNRQYKRCNKEIPNN